MVWVLGQQSQTHPHKDILIFDTLIQVLMQKTEPGLNGSVDQRTIDPVKLLGE
jgi:hypothetical protein